MSTQRPFDDLLDLIGRLSDSDTAEENGQIYTVSRDAAATANISELLGWLSLWQKSSKPKLDDTHICIFVSSYDECNEQVRLKEFISNAGKGQEPVSKLCKDRGVGLRVFEMAPEMPHVVSEQWPENQCMAAVGFGMEATAAGGNILGLAALAPGNEAYCLGLCQSLVEYIYPVGQDNRSARKGNAVVMEVLDRMKNNTGREVAAIVGALIAARSQSLPVLIEGWSAIAALCVLTVLDLGSADHVRVASVDSFEQTAIIEALGKRAIVGGTVDLGPGCGVAIAHSIISSMANLVD